MVFPEIAEIFIFLFRVDFLKKRKNGKLFLSDESISFVEKNWKIYKRKKHFFFIIVKTLGKLNFLKISV